MQLALNALLSLCVLAGAAFAQEPAPGLRLYSQLGGTQTYLVDRDGQTVHQWNGTLNTGTATYLGPDGSMYRAVWNGLPTPLLGAGGRVQRVDLDGNLIWDFVYDSLGVLAHHDIEVMPNGNVLMLAWEDKSVLQAMVAGRNPVLMNGPFFRPDHVIEVRPTGPTSGEVVWEWHVWDHLVQDYDPSLFNYGVVSEHPELIDVNYPPVAPPYGDWNHMNSIDYDPINDWIILSVRENNEIWIIDHSTTTVEAAGHTGGNHGKGGDLLYRSGNPLAYGRGVAGDLQIFGQHGAITIPPGHPGAGNVLMFANWEANPGESQVVEIELPLDEFGHFLPLGQADSHGPAAPAWSYSSPDFGSDFVSNAERLPNGNTLICSGIQGLLREVTPSGQVVWDHPTNGVVFHVHYVERTAWNTSPEFSLAVGGTQEFRAITGSEFGGAPYACLASLSGSSPGFDVNGVHVPINVDAFTSGVIGAPDTAPYTAMLGSFDSLGRATASFALPGGLLPPDLVGLQFDHAFVWLDSVAGQVAGASNAMTFTFVD